MFSLPYGGTSHQQSLSQGPYATDFMLHDISRELASAPRRSSRGSNGQRTGSAMRVVKPSSSTNTSPRHPMLQARRRTVINDGLTTRPMPNQTYLFAQDSTTMMSSEPVKRTSRPVSWHPSSHLVQQQVPLQQPVMGLPYPSYAQHDLMGFPQYPPTPAAYSEYNSPSSFSPLALPTAFSACEAPSYFTSQDYTSTYDQAPAASMFPSPNAYYQAMAEQVPFQGSLHTSSHWDMHPASDLGRCTAPPTPENFAPAQQLVPQVSSDDIEPYPPLGNEEEEGEILIGMGLYDPPEKEVVDPALGNYMASMASHLGASYGRESTGKGLKLEDAWEPPEMSDEDEDKDADGEEQDEEDL